MKAKLISFFKNNFQTSAVLIVSFAVVFLGYYTCPIRYLFGIPCPGCGMTRAYLSLLKLDFAKAFEYQSLFPIPILAVIYFLFRKKLAFSKTTENILLYTVIGVFLLRWIIRM